MILPEKRTKNPKVQFLSTRPVYTNRTTKIEILPLSLKFIQDLSTFSTDLSRTSNRLTPQGLEIYFRWSS